MQQAFASYLLGFALGTCLKRDFMIEARVGPILLARGADRRGTDLAALLLLPTDLPPPALEPAGSEAVRPIALGEGAGRTIWRYEFRLPAEGPAQYRLDEEVYTVATASEGQERIAFVSCNGQEEGDLERPEEIRNALWYRLRREHEKAPFHLLLHGGDQLYADPVWKVHPALARWNEGGRRERERQALTEEMRRAAADFYVERYCQIYTQPPTAWLLARVPSLMMWDDHDIFDGWGSHPEWLLDSPVAAGVFAEARRAFCLLQLGIPPDQPPPGALDPGGQSLGWCCRLPGFSVLAPDLRSERRPHQIMGPAGWQGFRRAVEEEPEGRRILLLSSVPALGPRLSWVEACIGVVPKLRDYEDDLRDQWQSRHHRSEWTRFLSYLEQQTEKRGLRITLLSGEIHLATRAEMTLAHGPLHQLVASGIAHPPPPKAYAAGLGLLARFGEAPLPGRPITLYPLPGRRGIYAAERNFLLLESHQGDWQATWYLEESGWSGPLTI